MALVRLIAALALALAACRASEAGSTSGLTPPAGWKPLPELATAAGEAAKQANILVDGSEAWGEPARGCYAAWFALKATPAAPAKIAEQLVASMTADVPGLATSEVVQPDAKAEAGVMSLAFAKAPYTGRVRTQIAKTGALTLLVCYWNEREPAACETACTGLLGALK